MGSRSRLRRERKAREAFDEEWERKIRIMETAVDSAVRTGSVNVLSEETPCALPEMREQMLTGMRDNLVSQLSKGRSREEIMEAANRMLGDLRANERYMRIMQLLEITDDDLEKLFTGAATAVTVNDDVGQIL